MKHAKGELKNGDGDALGDVGDEPLVAAAPLGLAFLPTELDVILPQRTEARVWPPKHGRGRRCLPKDGRRDHHKPANGDRGLEHFIQESHNRRVEVEEQNQVTRNQSGLEQTEFLPPAPSGGVWTLDGLKVGEAACVLGEDDETMRGRVERTGIAEFVDVLWTVFSAPVNGCNG